MRRRLAHPDRRNDRRQYPKAAQPAPPEPTMRQERTHPGHDIRSFCAARDRLRAEGDLAMAGWPARAGKPGGGRSAPPRGAPDRTARIAGGECVALCAAQAAAAAELRGAGLSPRGFGLLSRLCPLAPAVVAKEIGAAPDDRRASRRDLG